MVLARFIMIFIRTFKCAIPSTDVNRSMIIISVLWFIVEVKDYVVDRSRIIRELHRSVKISNILLAHDVTTHS